MPSARIEFTGSLGHPLAGRLDTPDGAPRAWAVFAHCFTCSKDSKAAAVHRARPGRGRLRRAALRFHGAGRQRRRLRRSPRWLKPAAGSVRLFGEEIVGIQPDALVTRGLSLVPEGRRLFATMTVGENLEIGAYQRHEKDAVARDFERVLQYFPALRGRLRTPAGSLSGGQQQMLAVARALMSAPRLLLLDEPTIGLAPAVVDTIAEIIKTIARSGVDVLLVEQNAEMALEIADEAFILERGRIIMAGPAATLARSEEVRRAYLGI